MRLRSVVLAAVLALGLGALAPAFASASTAAPTWSHQTRPHSRISPSLAPTAGTPLILHGGSVAPSYSKLDLVFWGDWSSTPNSTAMSRVEAFFGDVPGTAWAGVVSQYCGDVNFGVSGCGAQSYMASMPTLGSVWNDTTAPPASPTLSQVAAEANAGIPHFSSFNIGIDHIIVLTPQGITPQGFGTQFCAIHGSFYWGGGFRVPVGLLPFIPDQNSVCGSTVAAADPFSGFTIQGGELEADMATDPLVDSYGYPNGWFEPPPGAFQYFEIGDLCDMPYANAQQLTMNGHQYWVQPLFSNRDLAFGNGACQFALGPAPTPNAYHPITPVRVYDSRCNGSGTFSPFSVRTTQITGTFAASGTCTGAWTVPAGATAIAVNVGVTDTGGAPGGYILVYPSDHAHPLASTVNWGNGQTAAVLTQVQLSADGKLAIYNDAGYSDVFLDLAGYYGGPAPPVGTGLYNALPAPVRVLDTRPDQAIGGRTSRLGPGDIYTLDVTQVLHGGTSTPSGIPSTATAVVLNLAEVVGTAYSYLAVWPAGTAWPGNSNLNFPPNRVLANRVIVELGTGGDAGKIQIKNSQGDTDVLVDVAGWFSGGSGGDTTGKMFTPLPPARILDTRASYRIGYWVAPVAAGQSLSVTSVPKYAYTVASMNVTVLEATTSSYLGVYTTPPSGSPSTSDINFQPGDILPNLAITQLTDSSYQGGGPGYFYVFNSQGDVQVFIDLNGFYS